MMSLVQRFVQTNENTVCRTKSVCVCVSKGCLLLCDLIKFIGIGSMFRYRFVDVLLCIKLSTLMGV